MRKNGIKGEQYKSQRRKGKERGLCCGKQFEVRGN